MKKLNIKTFVIDSRRPTWLIELLFYIKNYFPYNMLDQMPSCNAISWIESNLSEIRYVRRNSVYKLTDCIRYEF